MPCPVVTGRGVGRSGTLPFLASVGFTFSQAFVVQQQKLAASLESGLAPTSPNRNYEDEVEQSRSGLGGGGAGGAVSEEMPLCISGRALPRLYILGVTKCGTTTMAKDLRTIGARYTLPRNKEGHLFDAECGFNHSASPSFAGCPAPTEDFSESLPEVLLERNCSRQPTLLEATPQNFRIPGLPQHLSALYADQAWRLGFILLFREPLARLHSHWWMRQNGLIVPGVGTIHLPPSNNTFAGFLADQDRLTQPYKDSSYEGMGLDKTVDYTYRSLYSLPLPGWLQVFASDQFLIVPMTFYVNSTAGRDASLVLISSKFGGTLSPDRLRGREVTHGYNGSHPPLEKEVDKATIEHWYTEYFKPDLWHLARLLAEHVPSGLTVAGYSGGGGVGTAAAEGMFNYICEAFPCLV